MRPQLIRASAYLCRVTVFALRTPESVLTVRFVSSPVWETLAAVRTLIDARARTYHEPWHQLAGDRLSRIDLSPLLAVEPLRGYVPDFLTPPPRTPAPRLRDQLAEIRATPLTQVVHELETCRETVTDVRHRRVLDSLLQDPARARNLLTDGLHEAWSALVAPFWVRIRTLLDRDIEQRSRTLARHGLRRTLDELHPCIRWTKRGLSVVDRTGRTIEVGERGLVLMPSAYLWPYVAAIVDEPWQPTIAYPAHGIAELWRAPTAAPDALTRLLGQTRALVLTSLGQAISTTALAEILELSPAGVSRHLLALRDNGLVTATRRGHQIHYSRTPLGSALLNGGRR
jgi:DNA-binding transcriptional ArsR family regulator